MSRLARPTTPAAPRLRPGPIQRQGRGPPRLVARTGSTNFDQVRPARRVSRTSEARLRGRGGGLGASGGFVRSAARTAPTERTKIKKLATKAFTIVVGFPRPVIAGPPTEVGVTLSLCVDRRRKSDGRAHANV